MIPFRHQRPLLFIAFISQIILASCSGGKDGSSEKPQEFRVLHPVVMDTVFTREYIAEIHSLRNVEIRTRIKGFLEAIHVDEGRPVKAGQLLFTLGSREYRENLLKANANYKSLVAELKVAEVELKNTRTLAEKNIVSSTELEMAIARKESVEAKIDEARSAIALANLNLSFTEVRAPFDGVIDRIPFKTGSLVGEGELLTTISDNREVFAYFNVSEKEFIDIVKRDSVESMKEVSLMMANNELFGQKGRIETVESVIDRGTGNIAFRARFANPRGILKHGASGRILVNERIRNAMVIPQKSTFEIQDRTYVYTVDSANTVKVRNFIPRLRLPHLFVVESGLSPNDRVLYEGIQQVRDGMKIAPKDMTFRDAKFD